MLHSVITGGETMKTRMKAGISLFALVALLFVGKSVFADQNTLKMYDGLDDNAYVLYTPDGGGFIMNKDGNPNFSEEQIKESNGEVVTVAQAKIYAANYTPFTFRARTFPTIVRSRTLGANQVAKETVSGPGWQHSRFYYNPAPKTGAYLLWTSVKDSGVVYDSSQDIRALEANVPTYIMSDVNRGTALWGVAYKTYNAPEGTIVVIENR